MKITGVGSVISHLTNVARKVGQDSRGAMKRSADRIVKEARANVPVDTHDLESSIEARKTYEDNTRRLQIEIVAGEGLEEYALKIHEGVYNLGPKSRAKQEADPSHIVGPKFLERAVEEERAGLERRQIEAVTRAIEE